MTLALRELYPETPRYIIVLFDLTILGAAEELHHARGVWQQDSDIETLDEDHFVLVLRPGGAARRLAS